MWTVIEKLPKFCLWEDEQDVDIVNPYKFDPHEFRKTWRLPSLRHRKLANLIRKLEIYGLGSTTDISLCMIPAFSFKDLLPNDQILKLVPQISPERGWVETARSYKDLLLIDIGTQIEERFSLSVVVMIMDFLYFALEPYYTADHLAEDDYPMDNDKPNENNVNKETPTGKYDDLDSDFRSELFGIVSIIALGKLKEIVKKLAPLYELQGRRKDLAKVFQYFESDVTGDAAEEWQSIAKCFREEKITIPPNFFTEYTEKLGFSKVHVMVCTRSAIIKDMIESGDSASGIMDLKGFGDDGK